MLLTPKPHAARSPSAPSLHPPGVPPGAAPANERDPGIKPSQAKAQQGSSQNRNAKVGLQKDSPLLSPALQSTSLPSLNALGKTAWTLVTPGMHRGHGREVFKIHSAADATKIHPGVIK